MLLDDTLINDVTDIIVAVSAAATAVVAFWGVTRWQKELTGKRSYEVAVSLLTTAYALEQHIKVIRSGFFLAHEFPDEYDPVRKSPGEEASAYQFIYSNRWKVIADTIPEWKLLKFESKAVHSKPDIQTAINNFDGHLNELYAGISSDISNKVSGGQAYENDPEFAEKITKLIIEHTKDDAFNTKIGNTLKELEEALKPYLGR